MKIKCIQNYQNRNINFKSNKTYAIIGASGIPNKESGSEEILKYMNIASDLTKYIVEHNDSIVSGCGNNAIMGSAYYSAYNNGSKAQNKVIIKQPEWGDEDKEHCNIIGYSASEADRVSKFKESSDALVIFPGSCGTLQEATQLIYENYYSNDKKPLVLVGKNFFEGLNKQYKYLFDNGYLNKIKSLDELYKIVDTLEELKEFVK